MATKDQVITQKHSRVWLQYGAARPNNSTVLGSVNSQHLAVSGVTMPSRGGIDRIRVHDPRRPGQYITVGTSESPADFDTANLMIREKHGGLSRLLQRDGCAFNLYILTGKCRDLSDFLGGWTDRVTILSGCEDTSIDRGDIASFDSDDTPEPSLDLTVTGGIYDIGSLMFGEAGSTEVEVEILDVAYGNSASCGDCGPANDGTLWRYALTTTGDDPAGVVYSVDGGATWTALAITGIGASEVPTAIRVIGNNLVVFSKVGGGATLSSHYISPINQKTGVPSSTWTEVSTGYVATFTLNDVYVVSPTEVYIAASGGYIYGSSDITAGVTPLSAAGATSSDLNRIHGTNDGTIVAVGASGAVVKSLTRGDTWATTTVPVAATLQALHVLDQDRYWVGSSAGNVYYTLNGGETWTVKPFTGSAAGSIKDIRFATEEVGYIAHTTAAPIGRVIATWDGGNTWSTTGNSRVLNMPTNLRLNRIAIPDAAVLQIRANNLMLGGLSAGTDGIIVLGTVNTF